MSFKTPKFFLFLIISVGVILRFWQLGNVPPSPNWDEVSLGYNAYSILLTGRDEYGSFLPPVLRSFDDYKPALYAYLTIPAIAVFGLNEFAVRLPSAIFGIISIVAVYLLVKELFKGQKQNTEYIALAAALFMAISPWAIQFSRVGIEASVGVTFNILMVLCFLKSFKKPYFLIISAILAGITIYIYQSEKVFIPLMVLALALIYKKQLFSLPKKYILGSIIVGFLIVLPMISYITINRDALIRIQGTSIFSSKEVLLKENAEKTFEDNINNDYLGLILDNRRVVYAKTVLSGYLKHFDLNWLFTTGDINRHHAPNMGNLYLFELPLILLGMYFLIFGKFDRKIKLLIFTWVLAAPLPASITVDIPHSIRTINFLPTFQIFSALGLFFIISRLREVKNYNALFRIAVAIYLFFMLFNFSFYINQYFVQLNYFTSQDWQYGWKQAVAYAKENGHKYDRIIVTNDEPLEKSYMFFLFYLKYPPSEYQKIGVKASGGFLADHYFDKYNFRDISWGQDSKLENTLIIGRPQDMPSKNIIKEIYNLDGSVAIKIAEN